ncbi:MAG: hypothetical protein QF824_05980 [Candidatus Woesearchaeota archaeon]|jgi:chromosome segregation ATPase|nr:hypothetical protein [Candidatus Woesearchaeota archaeon]
MLQNIKDLLQIKDHIHQINEITANHTKTLSPLKEEINNLKNQISTLKESQTELLNYLKESLGSIDNIKEDLKKEVYEFNLLKSQLQTKLVEKFETELKNELNINLEKLKEDHQKYDDARQKLASLVDQTSELNNNITNLNEIGKNIKKEDFELTNHANKLLETDREKLELMKKIDTLERLISKMRQTNRR